MYPENQAGPEDQGVLALLSQRWEPEEHQDHREYQELPHLQDLLEVHHDRGVLGLPSVRGIQERQADRCLPSNLGHQEDQRNPEILDHRPLPSVRGSQAGREHRDYPSLP